MGLSLVKGGIIPNNSSISVFSKKDTFMIIYESSRYIGKRYRTQQNQKGILLKSYAILKVDINYKYMYKHLSPLIKNTRIRIGLPVIRN